MPPAEQNQTEGSWAAYKHREFDRYIKYLVDSNLLDGVCPFNPEEGGSCAPAWEKCKDCEYYDLIHAAFPGYGCPGCGKYNALAASAEPVRATDPVTAGEDAQCWTAWYKCPLCGAEIEVEEST